MVHIDVKKVGRIPDGGGWRAHGRDSDHSRTVNGNKKKTGYVVGQTFALLHQFKRLAGRWERRLDLHNAFVSLGCGLLCWRRLKKAARP